MQGQYHSLEAVKDVQRSYMLNAERDRQVRESKRSQRRSKPGLRQQVGQGLMKLGQKLTQEPGAVFEQL